MTRSEAIRIISKALECAENEEIGEAYCAAVKCKECPVEEECSKGYAHCFDFIAEKLYEEERHG